MTRRGVVSVAVLAAVVLVCLARRDPCVRSACEPHVTLANWTGSAGAGLVTLLAVSLLALAVRAGWSAVRVQLRLRGLEMLAHPPALRAAVRRTGLRPGVVRCVASPRSTAFCVGLFRPSIYVSTGLLARLRPGELDAVLIHEGHHAARLEPLRRLLARALAVAFFYVPICQWWSARRAEESELVADATAAARRGRPALAGAIYAVGEDAPDLTAAISFHGALEIRIAHLLEEPLPSRRPSRDIWVQTAAGLLTAFLVSMCVAEETSRHIISSLI